MVTTHLFFPNPGAMPWANQLFALHSVDLALMWPHPMAPVHNLIISALVATLPLGVVLILMGGLRKSGALSAGVGLGTAFLVAILVWRMPWHLALLSVLYGLAYALWPILWIVFASLWLYNLSVDIGNFEMLRRWMSEHASGDQCIQIVLVAFCFGALLEATSGFGIPVAVAGFLLLGLGFAPRKAVALALIGNTTSVAFGGLGIPIVALAGVTGLSVMKLSAMAGRQLFLLSLILPAYLVWVVDGRKGLKRVWPIALVCGVSFALAQLVSTNYWGPYAAGIVSAIFSIGCVVGFLRLWKPATSAVAADSASAENPPAPQAGLTTRQSFAAWAPWVLLAVVMVAWSYFHLMARAQRMLPIPHLHNAVFITLYNIPYAAVFTFQPLAAGTAALTAMLLTALLFRTPPRTVVRSGMKTLLQLRISALTVGPIVALAFLYNYSGMAYTLGAALAGLGKFFPLVSGFLGWTACFLSGSDTSANLLFGNLQVAAGHQIGVNPILLAATNSSGGVTAKMISPQSIAVGVTTVGLVGHEGDVVRSTIGHSLFFLLLLSLIAFAQAYWLQWMIP
jgi:lactate permease